MQSSIQNILKNPELVQQLSQYVASDNAGAALESMQERVSTRTQSRGLIPVASSRPSDLINSIERISEGQPLTLSPPEEAIILRAGRPVLFIKDDVVEEPVLPLWQDRLAPARQNIEKVVPSCGRIELRGHARFPWAGTGWLVAPNLLITNRHVANLFAFRDGEEYKFRLTPDGKQIRARIDRYQEHGSANESEFSIREVLHIEDENGPDMALFRVASTDQDDQQQPPPVPLAEFDAQVDQVVGAIGYAAWDGDRNERELMDAIFEDIYEVKRLHPGEVMAAPADQHFVNHDCSTLGGNSGSAIIDFESGAAVALHYAGRFENKNYAVKASTIRQRLDALGIDIAVGV